MEHAKQATLAQQLDSINEYEREPVPESQTKKFKSFLGMMAGEHIAGTEFVIGPLFVLHGAAAGDIFLGLLVGNILATLSWTLVCAPVAVKTRLTIYYQLEKICGRRLVSIFNAINGFQSCALAASMIAVSATAVALFFNMPVPGLTDLYPNSFSWIVAVALIGAVITVVTIFGYDKVAQFSGVCAPWLPLVFLAAGLSALPALGVSSVSDFWQVAQDKIWTGVPQPGQTKYTFWHIVIFSWLCNSAMHIGMSDMSLYRYAKKASYGLASAAGMFIGHYMAWIASGILCALALQAGNTNPSPGQIAYGSAGIAGIVCVVVAGWTTANPTIYRAGLALQALMPQVKRWKVTLYVGIVASLLACLPAVVSKLDEVLGVYALFVAPVGAVILLDVYVFPKLGLKSNYAEKRRIPFNWVVAITWVVSMLAGYALYVYTKADFFFFMAVPCWFIAAFLYILLSKLTQQKEPVPAAAQSMRK